MEKQYKRQQRELDDTTKQKISQSLTGRSKSYTHAQNISKGMLKYWASVPSKNKDEESSKPDVVL